MKTPNTTNTVGSVEAVNKLISEWSQSGVLDLAASSPDLFKKSLLTTISQLQKQARDEEKVKCFENASYEELCYVWLKRYEGLEHMHVRPEAMYTINTILRRCFEDLNQDTNQT